MRPFLSKRYEIPPGLLKGAAVVLALPSWIFIIALVVGVFFFSRWLNEHTALSGKVALACWSCSLLSRFLFFHSLRDVQVARRWIRWAEPPIVLIPLLGLLLAVYAVMYLLLGLSRGPDSM